MSPNPIRKVLSTIRKHRVRALLIGGQACIFHGAIEFSRDSDFVILVSEDNLQRLQAALSELNAEPIYFPSLNPAELRKGHACHFRCRIPEADGMRVDILAHLRGCAGFATLWRRRVEFELEPGATVPVIGLRDLVQAKKTQRDKDWLMLRRLVDNDILLNLSRATKDQVRWWLRECRSAGLLVRLAQSYPADARSVAVRRKALRHAQAGDLVSLERALRDEEETDRKQDREYWAPLKQELEKMRRAAFRPRR